jgi:hypothetical protein
MSSKLDTSLDDILKTRRSTNRRGGARGGRRSDAGRSAPTGSGAPAQETSGKILVSGLVSASIYFASD